LLHKIIVTLLPNHPIILTKSLVATSLPITDFVNTSDLFYCLLCISDSPSIIFFMSHSFKLFRLQQIDTLLDKGRARLEEIDLLLADDHEVQMSQQHLDLAKKAQFEAEKSLRIAEQNVKEQRLKIERSQATLYGGKVVNPKELQDLQQESEALKRYLMTLEDLQLEGMLAYDEAETSFLEASDQHSAVKTQIAQQKEQFNAEKVELIQDLERQEIERQAAAANIDSPYMQLYEALRKQKNGIAVARVLEKTCAACGSTLTATTFSSAQMPTKLTRCTTCGRILYVG
jgi:predicted  nucleic acid-binding Zn-ribbon protein